MIKISADRYKKIGFKTKKEAIIFIKEMNIVMDRGKKNETVKQRTVRENNFLKEVKKIRIMEKKNRIMEIKKKKKIEKDNKLHSDKINNITNEVIKNYIESLEEKKYNENRVLYLNTLRPNREVNSVNYIIKQKTSGYDFITKGSNMLNYYNNIDILSINNSANVIINNILNELISAGLNMMSVQIIFSFQEIDKYDSFLYDIDDKFNLKKKFNDENDDDKPFLNPFINLGYIGSKISSKINNNNTIFTLTYTIDYNTIKSHNFKFTLIDINRLLLKDMLSRRGHYGDKGLTFIYSITGIKVLPVMNGSNINSIINNILAFSPNVDYSYHNATKCSTTKDRLCIYETYYYLYVDGNNIISKNINKIKDELEKESDTIKNYIKKGELANFLIEKSKTTKEVFYVEFYRKIDIYCGFKVDNGEIIALNSQSDLEGIEKIFLYDKQHVAPRKINVVRKEVNNKVKQYTLRSTIKKSINDSPSEIIGYDFETYCDKENNCVPYCLCLSNGQSFYGDNVVNEFCDYLDSIKTETNTSKTKKKTKVPKILIYGFNNSRFDNLLLFGELNNRLPTLKYCIMGSSIKYIKYYNISIYDINLYYAGSLSRVSAAFKLNISKGVFPYRFVNKDNIYYNGEVPDVNLWNSKEDYEEYKTKEGSNFNMREYSIKYCKLDAELVKQIGEKHYSNCMGYIESNRIETTNNKTGITYVNSDKRYFNVCSSPTGAGLSLKMFQQGFLKNDLYAPPAKVQEKERLAYYGGRTEVFKKKFISKNGEKLYYYDINSSYPFAMTYMMPYKYINTINIGSEVMSKFTDYFLYKAKSEYKGNDEFFIPNLLHRSDKGDIIAVKNAPEGYHWGCELNEAVKNNCEITVSEIIQYEGQEIFKEFSNYFYNERLKVKKTAPALAEYYKLIMNSLYGKFGQSLKPETKICQNADEIAIILNNENNKLVDFQTMGDKVILKYNNLKNEERSVGHLIRFSSYISAVAKCNLSIFMRDVGHNNVYYCDTDSVFTTKKPSDYLISQSELGKWKLESVQNKKKEDILAEITEAIFLAPKSYMYKIGDEYTCMKAKGQPSNKLEAKHFVSAEKGEKVNITNDTMFFRSLEGVKIKPQDRTLSVVFNKRIFIGNDSIAYNEYSEWYSKKYNSKNNI